MVRFVCAMSQGPVATACGWIMGLQTDLTVQRYAERVARNAARVLKNIEYRDWVELNIVEKKIQLQYRTPSEERLAWARPIAARIANDVPKDRTEVYAQEALILHERKQTELKLQAIRIGELTMATLQRGLCAHGLKLRSRAPSRAHFNIELANGAEGYIPLPNSTLSVDTRLACAHGWIGRTGGAKDCRGVAGRIGEVTGKSRRKEPVEPRSLRSSDSRGKACLLLANGRDGWKRGSQRGTSWATREAPSWFRFLSSRGWEWIGVGKEETLTPSPFSGPPSDQSFDPFRRR